MSSSAAIYVDDTMVAYEVRRLFQEAARRRPGGREVDFFEYKGSFGCFVKALARRIDQRVISLHKKSDIRREVKKFLQYLEDEKILRKAEKGRHHDEWLFRTLPIGKIELVNGAGAPVVKPALSASRPPKRLKKKRRGHGGKAKPSYVNDSWGYLSHV